MSYVGYASVPSDENGASLHQVIERYTQPGNLFFLRWLHQVSGIITELPDQLSPEGQLFNANFELRWKKRQRGYDVLWLGQNAPDSSEIFTAIKRQWQTEDHPALLHDRKTPQYPNLFKYPRELKVWQRYFRDAETGIVHFIALTVSRPQPSDSSPFQS